MGELESETSVGLDPFFKRLEFLISCGVLEWQPYLASDDIMTGGDLLFPISWGYGQRKEEEIGRAAHRACVLLARDRDLPWGGTIDPDEFETVRVRLVPMLRRMPAVQLVQVARLVFRPHTALTGMWRGIYEQQMSDVLSGFERLVSLHDVRKSAAA